MGQGVFDFFAAAGLGISGFLLNGLNQNLNWFWLVLAAAGLLWSIAQSAVDEEGVVLFLKQLCCMFLSAVLIFGYLRVDLAPYSYIATGKLEATLERTTGGAILPTYAVLRVGQVLMVDGRELLSKGKSTSIPNVIVQADLLATDEDVLDDKQLKANLAIWNQIVAPYILKQDPEIESALGQAGLIQTFMVPIPSSRDFMGQRGDQAAKVQEILASSKLGVGEMLCTLQTFIETSSTKYGGTMWSSDNGTCVDPSINVFLAKAPKKAATKPFIWKRPPQEAWDQGSALISSMITASGVDSKVQAITSLGQLYSAIGQSGLYIAANNYASDSDKVVTLGTACDKMSTQAEPSACSITQASLASAMGGLTASTGSGVLPIKQGFWDNVTGAIAYAGGWTFTSIFRILVGLLSAMTAQVIPYAIGVGITCALILSAIGPYLLLWPRKFSIAMEWMIGPVAFICLWAVLHNVWTEVDTWIMLLIGQIGSIISEDRLMGKNIAGIICSLGYLGMPFLAYTILFGSVGNAISKTTGLAGTSVKMGAVMTMFLARAAAQFSKSGGSGGGSPSPGSTSPGNSGSAPSSSAPPSNAPPTSSSPGSSANRGGSTQGGAPQSGSGGSPAAPPSSGSTSAPPSSSAPSSGGSAPPSSAPTSSGGSGGSMPSGQAGYGASQPAAQSPSPRFKPMP